jgi:hypothetical protein
MIANGLLVNGIATMIACFATAAARANFKWSLAVLTVVVLASSLPGPGWAQSIAETVRIECISQVVPISDADRTWCRDYGIKTELEIIQHAKAGDPITISQARSMALLALSSQSQNSDRPAGDDMYPVFGEGRVTTHQIEYCFGRIDDPPQIEGGESVPQNLCRLFRQLVRNHLANVARWFGSERYGGYSEKYAECLAGAVLGNQDDCERQARYVETYVKAQNRPWPAVPPPSAFAGYLAGDAVMTGDEARGVCLAAVDRVLTAYTIETLGKAKLCRATAAMAIEIHKEVIRRRHSR